MQQPARRFCQWSGSKPCVAPVQSLCLRACRLAQEVCSIVAAKASMLVLSCSGQCTCSTLSGGLCIIPSTSSQLDRVPTTYSSTQSTLFLQVIQKEISLGSQPVGTQTYTNRRLLLPVRGSCIVKHLLKQLSTHQVTTLVCAFCFTRTPPTYLSTIAGSTRAHAQLTPTIPCHGCAKHGLPPTRH